MTSFSDQYACSGQFLLQFPTRYLEWITIAREHSIDPTTSLDFNARTDGLTEDERKEILSVSAYLGVNPEIFDGGGEGREGVDLQVTQDNPKRASHHIILKFFHFFFYFSGNLSTLTGTKITFWIQRKFKMYFLTFLISSHVSMAFSSRVI